MTKQERKYVEAYFNSTKEKIYNCYVRPSLKKQEAEWQCKRKMHEQNGVCFRIIAYNDCFFTCGWLTSNGTLHVETPTRSIEIKEATLPL